MELAGWTRAVVDRGERKPVVEDYMVDVQHAAGSGKMGPRRGALVEMRVPG